MISQLNLFLYIANVIYIKLCYIVGYRIIILCGDFFASLPFRRNWVKEEADTFEDEGEFLL